MSYLTALLGTGLLALILAVGLIAARFGNGVTTLEMLVRLGGGDWARAMLAEMMASPMERRRSFARGCVVAIVAEHLRKPRLLSLLAALLLAILNFPWPGLIDPSANEPFHWTLGLLNDLGPMVVMAVAGWLSRGWLAVLAAAVWIALIAGIGVLAAVGVLLVMAGGDFGANPWFSMGIAFPGGAATGFLVGILGGSVGHLVCNRLSASAEPAASSD